MIILFDENFPCKIAEGIDIIESVNKDTILKCTYTHPYLLNKGGTEDDDWIAYAGRNNALIFSFDKDFRQIKSKGNLYIQHNVGVFFFKYEKKEPMYWQTVKLVVNHLHDIKKTILTVSLPFVYEISKKGVKRCEF